VEEGSRWTAIYVRNLGVCLAAYFSVERNRTSQPDALYLTQCNLVLCPIVEFGCSRRLMPGHLLGVLEPSVVLQVNRDAGCSPSVTSYGGQKTRRLSPLPNCSPGIVSIRGRPNTRVTSRKVAVSLPPPPPFQSPIGCSYPGGKACTDSRAPKLTA